MASLFGTAPALADLMNTIARPMAQVSVQRARSTPHQTSERQPSPSVNAMRDSSLNLRNRREDARLIRIGAWTILDGVNTEALAQLTLQGPFAIVHEGTGTGKERHASTLMCASRSRATLEVTAYTWT